MSECGCNLDETTQLEQRTLWVLLLINGMMFLLEAITGWRASSTGLLADSLDMLADASVYGIALFAAGRSKRLQTRAAVASGYLQIALGAGVLVEVARRFYAEIEPISILMISIGAVAFIANMTCLALLAKHREGKIHMRASWIFSVNDVLANLGLILAGCLVYLFNNRIPDLVIGTAISLLVIRGGIKILGEAREARARDDCV